MKAKLFKSTVPRNNLICFLGQLMSSPGFYFFFFQSCGFQENRKSIQTQNSWEIQPDKSPDWGGSEADVGRSGNRRILLQQVAEMEKWVTGVSC